MDTRSTMYLLLDYNTYYNLDATIADAILDRIVHNSLRIDLKGESLRRKKVDLKSAAE